MLMSHNNTAKDDAWLMGDYEYTEEDLRELREWNDRNKKRYYNKEKE